MYDLKIQRGVDIFESNPGLLLIPEFSDITSNQMKYVILYAWNKSPLRKLTKEDRHLEAMIASELTEKHRKIRSKEATEVRNGDEKIYNAVRRFIRVQGDIEYRALESYSERISHIMDYISDKKSDPKIAAELAKQLKSLIEERDELDRSIGLENMVDIGDGRDDIPEEELENISTIDKVNMGLI